VDATTIVTTARTALEAQARRAAKLVGSLPDSSVSIPGSEWTIREVDRGDGRALPNDLDHLKSPKPRPRRPPAAGRGLARWGVLRGQ
jgi:hypothetical protein